MHKFNRISLIIKCFLIGDIMHLSDQDFLNMQFLHLDTSYSCEITAIKNCENKLLYVSDKYAAEFSLTKEQICGQNITIIGINDDIAKSLLTQESELYNSELPLDLIYVHKGGQKMSTYLVRKRLIRNPHTNNVVGIQVNMEHFIPGNFRKTFIQLTKKCALAPIKTNVELTKSQNDIVFCLLLGFSGRKEVANIISFYTKVFCSEHRVKNELGTLYFKFNCNNTTSLLNSILLNNIEIKIPENILEAGSFIIQK